MAGRSTHPKLLAAPDALDRVSVRKNAGVIRRVLGPFDHDSIVID